MNRTILDAIRAARRGRLSLVLATDIETGAQTLVDPGTANAEIAAQAARGRPGLVAEGRQFVQVYAPAPRLIVIGAVHVAQKLVPLARLAELAVSVMDPRRGFATIERFPGVDLVLEWPDRGLAAAQLDSGTAVVTLSHDPKLDDPALIAALRSPAFYVGALGSRRTHAKRLDRLRAAGLDEADLVRIHAPVGLAIGAVSPAEIAVSILAEIVAVRRGGKASGAAS